MTMNSWVLMGGVGTVADKSFVVEEEAGLAETSEAARRVATSAVDTDASQCRTLVHIYTHTHTHTHTHTRLLSQQKIVTHYLTATRTHVPRGITMCNLPPGRAHIPACLEKGIMQGTMPGARRRGIPRTAWMDNRAFNCRILYDHYFPTVILIIIGLMDGYAPGPLLSPTHSFTLGLNPSFSANPPYRSLSFFSFRIHYMDFPDCLLLLLSISVFLLFSFSGFTHF